MIDYDTTCFVSVDWFLLWAPEQHIFSLICNTLMSYTTLIMNTWYKTNGIIAQEACTTIKHLKEYFSLIMKEICTRNSIIITIMILLIMMVKMVMVKGVNQDISQCTHHTTNWKVCNGESHTTQFHLVGEETVQLSVLTEMFNIYLSWFIDWTLNHWRRGWDWRTRRKSLMKKELKKMLHTKAGKFKPLIRLEPTFWWQVGKTDVPILTSHTSFKRTYRYTCAHEHSQ